MHHGLPYTSQADACRPLDHHCRVVGEQVACSVDGVCLRVSNPIVHIPIVKKRIGDGLAPCHRLLARELVVAGERNGGRAQTIRAEVGWEGAGRSRKGDEDHRDPREDAGDVNSLREGWTGAKNRREEGR